MSAELFEEIVPCLWGNCWGSIISDANRRKLRLLCSSTRALCDSITAVLNVSGELNDEDVKTLRKLLVRCGSIRKLKLNARCSSRGVLQLLDGLKLPGSLVQVSLADKFTLSRSTAAEDPPHGLELDLAQLSISPEDARQLDLADLLCRACPSVRTLALMSLPPQTYHLHSLLPCQHLQTLKLAVPPGATQHLHTISLLTQLTALHLLHLKDAPEAATASATATAAPESATASATAAQTPEDATAPTNPVQPEAGTTAPATLLPVPSTTGPTGLHWLCPLTQLRALELKTWGLIQQHKDLLALARCTGLTYLRFGESLLVGQEADGDQEPVTVPNHNPWTEVLCQLLPHLTRLVHFKLMPEGIIDSRILDTLSLLPKLSILKAHQMYLGRALVEAAGTAQSQPGRKEPSFPNLTYFATSGSACFLEDLHYVVKQAPKVLMECWGTIKIQAPLHNERGRGMLADVCQNLRQVCFHNLDLNFQDTQDEVPFGPWMEVIRALGAPSHHCNITGLILEGVNIDADTAREVVSCFPHLWLLRLRYCGIGTKVLAEVSQLDALRVVSFEGCYDLDVWEVAMFMGARRDVDLVVEGEDMDPEDWQWLKDIQASFKAKRGEAVASSVGGIGGI